MANAQVDIPVEDLEGFLSAAQSLKLYRRADLQDEQGVNLIEDLYVDPLPNEHVLKTLLRPNTTFLIGRKGTGKSTIFQRAQHELRHRPGVASAYIDIKTVYEQSQVDPRLLPNDQLGDVMPREMLERLLLYRAFLRAVVNELRDEVKRKIKPTLLEKFRRAVTGSVEEFFGGLDDLLDQADDCDFVSVVGYRKEQIKLDDKTSEKTKTKQKLGVNLADKPSLRADVEDEVSDSRSFSEEQSYADILMRVFNVKELITRLKALLAKVSVRHLYIFVDDFSELPEGAMRVVVDALLAPLNNWSDELIKFKVAAYPSRVYLGTIDKTKIDEVNLDLYRLYGGNDVSAMEDKAIDFTKRLVSTRISHFCDSLPAEFFESDTDELWRLLFYSTMANPRNLGYLLFFIYESHLIYGKRIGARAVRDAAQRYYEEKIESYFRIGKFLHEGFDERSSIYSLKELLEVVVRKARELREYRGSEVMKSQTGRPRTSHFHVVAHLEALLSTLELNFFLTKYFEMSDRDGRKVGVFALNFGLCEKYTIEFGRPMGKREYRLYFVERIFDYSALLTAYMSANQEILCSNCGSTFDLEILDAIKLFGMQCPKCKHGRCHVINLSKKYETVLESVDDALLLPATELGILQTLQSENRPLFAGEIAEDLDCSYQLVGRRGKYLAERGLVDRDENEQGRRQFKITDVAKESYFRRDSSDGLDVSEP